MPNLNPKRFSHPEVLSKIGRESLLKWLVPASEYFAAQGITLPNGAANGPLKFEALAAAFINPEPDMPEYLVESLEIINDMADERGMDAILEAATQRGVKLTVPDFCTPADVALEAWLQARELLEEVHLEHQLTRPRSFVHVACAEKSPPVITMPSAEQLKAIEARLDGWYSSKQRGRGCRVRAFPNGEECKFLIRHGDPCRREAATRVSRVVSGVAPETSWCPFVSIRGFQFSKIESRRLDTLRANLAFRLAPLLITAEPVAQDAPEQMGDFHFRSAKFLPRFTLTRNR